MTWIVKLTSPSGDVFYGEAIDREGFRYRCPRPEQAEAFDTRESAESTFYYFKLMRPLEGYQFEAVELESISAQ
ncbi:hypothetical protein C9I50_18025 [Pseudomonas prosekii]|uniref:hypothetical protein n=1 Tax=Pseudomonas prosekii TaxID=1148509 RepID=UPI000D620F3D|nr:hypothetical protein [Pseudomonas prosekii]PWE39572.1 hypothetical protein C9I50_18025 [Pseudomonas prosekii]